MRWALVMLGDPDVKLYDGSLLECSAYPNLPMELGWLLFDLSSQRVCSLTGPLSLWRGSWLAASVSP
jgi:hypothetical protein